MSNIILIAENGFDMFADSVLGDNNQAQNSIQENNTMQNQYQNQRQEQNMQQTAMDSNNFQLQQEIPVIEPSSEIPELPIAEPTASYSEVQVPSHKTEGQAFLNKMLTGIGALVLSIVLFLILANLFKKFFMNKQENDIYTYTEPEETKAINEEPEYIQSPVRKIKTSKLNTPSSIHKCILSFLEITKEN